MLGDLSIPLYKHEKKGGNPSHIEGRLDLMDFINREGLMDMDLQGIDFTWRNKRIGDSCIQIHLDRIIISPDWTQDFDCCLSLIQNVSSNQFLLLFVVDPL